MNFLKSIDPNSDKMHFLTLGIGAFLGMLDVIVLSINPDMTSIGLFVGLLIIPPFLLAAHDFDSAKEKKQLFVLTYFPSSIFGIGFGILAGAAFRHLVLHVKYDALESVPVSFSVIWTLCASFGVCMSFWTSGGMSREKRIDRFYGSGCPMSLRSLINDLKMQGLHIAADKLIKLLSSTIGREKLLRSIQISHLHAEGFPITNGEAFGDAIQLLWQNASETEDREALLKLAQDCLAEMQDWKTTAVI